MKSILRILVLMIAISSISNQLMAQWIQTNGPEGGGVHCFTVIGTNLFAGTDGGVFLSTNNGDSWTPVNSGLWNPVVFSLLVVDSNLFAGRYSVKWDASGYSSGIYFYRLQAGEFVETKKLVLLK